MRKLFVASVAILGMAALSGCTNEPRTIKVLTDMGYTNVEATGWRMFGCGEGDFYSTGFVATSVTGATVTGVVCAGLLKGTTVRFD